MKFKFTAVVASLTLGLATIASAETSKIDSVHSMVVFQISHLGVSNPFGVFHGVSGSVTTTDDVPALDIKLPVDKLDMGNEKWEQDIKAGSWFDVKNFPTIDFKTTSVKKTGENTFEATGDLTLHGVTKSVTVTLTKSGTGKGMQGETRVGYGCTFKVNRSDYGMTTFKGPVGDEVTLMVNLEAVQQ